MLVAYDLYNASSKSNMVIHPHIHNTDDSISTQRGWIRYVLFGLLFLCVNTIQARTTRVYGYVLDEQNVGIEYANVYVQDTTNATIQQGTTTNINGYYSINIPTGDTVEVVYSMIGYTTIRQQLYTERDVINVNVVLPTDNQLIDEVVIESIRKQSGTMQQTQAEVVRLMPDATGGSIESLLVTFSGVNQNNELSTQYNVRGGNFDENSVYVNGIEIHRPLLIRSGQQEGLSFVNPYMVNEVNFSAGGFDAQYGDKMSSVLDITYKKPTKTESSLVLSILGANGYVGFGDSTHTQMHGIRYKTSKYMLGALPAQGNYQPNFVDYQTQFTWKDKKTQWEYSLLGNFSLNSYIFKPDSMSESFGTYTQTINTTIHYEGQEKDRFITAFGAFTAKGDVLDNSLDKVSTQFTLSGFYTNEKETYDIRSEYELSLGGPADEATQSGSSSQGNINGNTDKSNVLGTGVSHEHARNLLQAGVVTLSHQGAWIRNNNLLKWGVSGHVEMIRDQINEWEWRDSMGYSLPNEYKQLNLFYSLKGKTQLFSGRIEGFIQNQYKWNTENGNITLVGGLRLNWWNFTNEVLISPRASVTWMPGWKRDLTFRFATGLYYQAPFYKELRQIVQDMNGVNRIEINQGLKAQRSVHTVLGTDYYFRAWGRPFKFTIEAYAKYIDRMQSYTLDNVRIRYAGDNDAQGYTLGLDMKLFGELVPGADSWVGISTMRSRMQFIQDPYNRGWIPSPQEQRWALTLFFQDYIPKLPQYKLHIKLLFSEGLPFGYPRNEQSRFLGRMEPYKRIDLGASRTFSAQTDKFMRSASAKHIESWSIYFEVFNVVGWKNINNYYWISAANGLQWASPNYLTGRMFNLKLSIDLK